jgi:hypothetical protein
VDGGFVLWNRTIELPTQGGVISLRPTQDEVIGPDAVSPGLPWLDYNPPALDQLFLAEKKAKIDEVKAERDVEKFKDKVKQDAVDKIDKIEEDLWHHKPADSHE